ncbi:MAG: N-acyl homoserine lactonase family protein [Candidatus Sphingomonas phytovorans]|nr:N-acyl homoserine lactonase family protein [Sphingomonas sp.]WEK02217.1 MAG: N-acyl homoserine lactonase family protein [Sphingomonas sp.]
MKETKVYLLDFGTLTLDGFQMFWNLGPSGTIRFPVYGALIDHADGLYLFDTGFDKETFDNLSPGRTGQTARQTVPGQLDLLGLKPSDINYVINSHYHLDHCGGNKHCTCAKTICHKLELEAALDPEPFEARGYTDMSFLPDAFHPPVLADVGAPSYDDAADEIFTDSFELLLGDQEIAKGIHLIETPGHTPGHYSLLVELAGRRPMLFSGDACYAKRSLDHMAISSSHVNPRQAYDSLGRLRDLARARDAEIFYSHDPEAWQNFKLAPLPYL